MYLTRHFVFVHIPKTGGNFVRELLERYAPADWQVQRLDDHLKHDSIPASHRDLPRLAIARNPFAWHVSWYHFQRKHPSDFFRWISADDTLDFRATMRRAYTGDGPLANSSGALTQTLIDMLGQGLEGAKVGKMETLRKDLLRLFGECVEVPAELDRAIRDLPPQNASRHAHYSTYYDDELRRIVRAKDAPVFDFFGYEWESAPPTADGPA
ncbi:MAG: hypothetical protein ACE37K_08765 [Planctomycetota bacterium]